MRKFYYLFLLTLFACWQVNAQFTESFDTEIPATWTIINNDGGNYTWEHQTVYPHTGAGHARIHWESAAHDDYLISPQFTVTTGVSDQLSFWAGIQGTTYPEDFEVRLSTVGTNPTDFTTLIASETATSDAAIGNYTQYTYNLSAYVGSNVYIAIVATDTDKYYLAVDDFEVGSAPSCPDVTNIMVNSFTASSVNFSWTAGATETDWEYVVQTAGTGEPTAAGTAVATTPEGSDASLNANTDYEIYVRAVCNTTAGSEEYGSWVGPLNFYTGYCNPTQSSTDLTSYIDDFTTSGTISNISNLATGRPGIYSDYTSMAVTSWAGGTFNFSIVAPGGSVGCTIWADFNNNLVFETSEIIYPSPGYIVNPQGTVTIPAGIANGDYRMRVLIDWSNSNPEDDCTLIRGEVEDYTLTITDMPTDAVDWANLQSFVVTVDGIVSDVTAIETCQTVTAYTQAWEDGVTNADTAAAGAGLDVWIAYSSDDTDPSTWDESLWIPATYNLDVGNNDEFGIEVSGLDVGTYYFASRWRLNYGPYIYGATNGIWDGAANTNAVLTVTDPVAITATADVMEICEGGTVNIAATSDDTSYMYVWDDPAETVGETLMAMPTETTTYTVTGTNAGGCVSTAAVTIIVHPLPSEITITPVDAQVCPEGPAVMLTAEGGEINTQQVEGFEIWPPTGWTFVQTGTDDPGFVQTDLEANSGSFSMYHNDDDISAASTSWAIGPPIDAVAGGGISFFYKQRFTEFYYNYSGVWISTTGADPIANSGDWTELSEFTGSENTWTEFVQDLTAYDGQTVYIAFKYNGDWDHEFYIDDFTVNSFEQGNITWSPATGLFTDEAATSPYVEGENATMVYAAEPGTYTVTATSSSGCETTTEVTVTAGTPTDTPVVDEVVQEFCPTAGATIADLVATGDNLQWYDAANEGNLLESTEVLVEGMLYYVSATSDGLCESARAYAIVDFDDSLCPAENDDCVNAEMLTVAGSAVSGNTSNATAEAVTACGATDSGVWYTVEGDGANLTVTVSPDGWDASIEVVEGDCAGGFVCNGSANTEGVDGVESYTFPSEEGTMYYIFVAGTDAGVGEGEFAIQVTTNLGIGDIESVDSSITLYPNPVSHILHMNTEKEVKVAQIFAADGSLVKEINNVSDNALDVSSLKTGNFIIRVFLDDNSVVTEKFIKK